MSAPTESTFSIEGLTESELNFIVNAVFSVQIQSKDAKLVSDLQTRLVSLLTPSPEVSVA